MECTEVSFILGLDPSAPNFENKDNAVKLDRSDADFVDIIHTDIEPLHTGGKVPLSNFGLG